MCTKCQIHIYNKNVIKRHINENHKDDISKHRGKNKNDEEIKFQKKNFRIESNSTIESRIDELFEEQLKNYCKATSDQKIVNVKKLSDKKFEKYYKVFKEYENKKKSKEKNVDLSGVAAVAGPSSALL